MKKLTLAAGIAGLCVGGVQAANYVWLANPLDSNWFGSANWDLGEWSADSGNWATFSTSTIKDVTVNGDVALSKIAVSSGDHAYTLSGGSITLNGGFDVEPGSKLTLDTEFHHTSSDSALRLSNNKGGTVVFKGAEDRTNSIYRVAANNGTIRFDGGTTLITCESTSATYNQVPLLLASGDVYVEGGALVKMTNPCGYVSNVAGDLAVTNGVLDMWNVGEYLNGFGQDNSGLQRDRSRTIVKGAGTLIAKAYRLGKGYGSATWYNPETYAKTILGEGGTLVVNTFTMDGSGTDYHGSLDFDGGMLRVTNTVNQKWVTITGNSGNWKNVKFSVKEGGAYVRLVGLTQYSTFGTPFVSGAEKDGGLHVGGNGFMYLNGANTFNGGLHFGSWGGYLIPANDSSLGAVPAEPTPSVFVEGSGGMILHFGGNWATHPNRDFAVAAGATLYIGSNSRGRIKGVIEGAGADGSQGGLKAVDNWSGIVDIGPDNDRTNRIGRIFVKGRLGHAAGTTLVTTNAPGKTGTGSPFYIEGNGSSYSNAKGVFEMNGGTLKITRSVWVDISKWGQLIVTNGFFDATATAELLNGLDGPGKIVVGDKGRLSCGQFRPSQDTGWLNGIPRSQIHVNKGGTLSVKNFWMDIKNAGNNQNCAILLNGGVLQARASTENFLGEGTGVVYDKWMTNCWVMACADGAVIDSNGNNITIKCPIRSGTEVDGGLRKIGAGTLTLAGTNGYNGATCVEAGKLAIARTECFPGGHLDFSAPALAAKTDATPYVTAPELAFKAGSKVRIRKGQTLDSKTFGGKKVLATVTTPFTKVPELALLDEEGDEIPSAAWKLTLSADGKTLLFGASRGTMVIVR